MIFKHRNCMLSIASFFNKSLISLMNVIMEWIFKSQGEELVSSFEFKSYSTNDGFVGTPTEWDTSSGIEESWTNFSGFEIFFKPSLFHGPSNNFYNIIRFVSNFNLVESISIPVVTLVNISAVVIVLHIVVMTEVIGGINECTSHPVYLIKIY